MDRIVPPPLPWHGRCQCGGVRYAVTRAPLTVYECHCTECQRQSASAHGTSMRLPLDGLEIEGEVAVFVRDEGKPTEVHCRFCPSCGVRIAHGRPGGGAWTLKPGTLDQTAWLAPAGYIWTGSAQAGAIFDETLPRFGGQPDDYGELEVSWARLLRGAPDDG